MKCYVGWLVTLLSTTSAVQAASYAAGVGRARLGLGIQPPNSHSLGGGLHVYA